MTTNNIPEDLATTNTTFHLSRGKDQPLHLIFRNHTTGERESCIVAPKHRLDAIEIEKANGFALSEEYISNRRVTHKIQFSRTSKWLQTLLGIMLLLSVIYYSGCSAPKQQQSLTSLESTPQENVVTIKEKTSHMCGAITKDGKKCTRLVADKNGAITYCWQHKGDTK